MGPVRLGVVTDVHLSPPGTPDGLWNNPTLYSRASELLDRVVAALAEEQVDHVIVLGDAAHRGDRASAVDALSAISRAGAPVWSVPGNHDVATDPETLPAAADSVTGVAALGPAPRPLASWVDVAGPRLVSNDRGETCEAIDLPATLESAAPLLVWATHYPVLSAKPSLHQRRLRYPGDLVNRRALQRLVQTRTAPTLVLHGHVHAAVAMTHRQTLQVGCSALVEWPHAWTLVTAAASAQAGLTVTVERRVLDGGPPPIADSVFTPPFTRWGYLAEHWQTDQAAVSPNGVNVTPDG